MGIAFPSFSSDASGMNRNRSAGIGIGLGVNFKDRSGVQAISGLSVAFWARTFCPSPEPNVSNVTIDIPVGAYHRRRRVIGSNSLVRERERNVLQTTMVRAGPGVARPGECLAQATRDEPDLHPEREALFAIRQDAAPILAVRPDKQMGTALAMSIAGRRLQ